VPAADGTTNALALAAPHLFAPLYGPNSADRFLGRADRLDVPASVAAIPNLAEDVDTLADLERLETGVGPKTAAALDALRAGLPR
jgi:2-phospho-L-lactate guanylyltransferase (CobY/MobA/RfbA family)